MNITPNCSGALTFISFPYRLKMESVSGKQSLLKSFRSQNEHDSSPSLRHGLVSDRLGSLLACSMRASISALVSGVIEIRAEPVGSKSKATDLSSYTRCSAGGGGGAGASLS